VPPVDAFPPGLVSWSTTALLNSSLLGHAIAALIRHVGERLEAVKTFCAPPVTVSPIRSLRLAPIFRSAVRPVSRLFMGLPFERCVPRLLRLTKKVERAASLLPPLGLERFPVTLLAPFPLLEEGHFSGLLKPCCQGTHLPLPFLSLFRILASCRSFPMLLISFFHGISSSLFRPR